MRVAMCQINPVMGDVAGNTARIEEVLGQTASEKPDLLVFPELAIQGYPPRDLLEHHWFIDSGLAAVDRLCEASRRYPETGILVGVSWRCNQPRGRGLRNSAVLIHNGEVRFRQDKSLLPTYDVFDEHRYFDPSDSVAVYPFKGEVLGISICEDAWNRPGMWERQLYHFDPIDHCARNGATLLINISASPFHRGKDQLRYSIIRDHAAGHKLPLIFVNQVGGNDELIFDGNSMVFDGDGSLSVQLASFREEIRMIDTDQLAGSIEPPAFGTIASLHDALVLGLSDYLRKCGFGQVLLGLSGGIDSAVTCCLAVEAVGRQNVLGVAMPSRYSSEGSVQDARKLADSLGIELKVIQIEPMFSAFEQELHPHFAGHEPDVAEENLQARIRGNILMALSNKFNKLLLSTGNKSEMAVGYCTLYGDMNGGLSVISDVPKTMVYELAEFINRDREIIPADTIAKPPSAELRPDQKDQDTLPSYEVLDAILAMFIEKGASSKQVIERGHDPKIVEWVSRALAINEYKRRQAAPGLKVSPKAFGSGRRFPIAARYRR